MFGLWRGGQATIGGPTGKKPLIPAEGPPAPGVPAHQGNRGDDGAKQQIWFNSAPTRLCWQKYIRKNVFADSFEQCKAITSLREADKKRLFWASSPFKVVFILSSSDRVKVHVKRNDPRMVFNLSKKMLVWTCIDIELQQQIPGFQKKSWFSLPPVAPQPC